ncbi:MAG TPA: hypothetical protein VGQ99_06165 [Tepidisphaeraceae bacterium]|jgi:hypothetical protein|nr:hypothetical protein [Tepidisphaeraceae bacterium]
MIRIRFTDAASERRAFSYLSGRFSFKSWKSGETILHESALPFLALEGIAFFVEGLASYEQIISSVRDRRVD